MKSAYLIKVSPSDNNNRYYRMTQQGNIFAIEMGRVGATPVKSKRPMSLWDTTLRRKLAEGYVDRSGLCQVAVESNYAPLANGPVKDLMDDLMGFASKKLDDSYSVSYEEVTPAMVARAQELIFAMDQEKENLAKVQKLLVELFVTIPRKMQSVEECTPTDISEVEGVLQREQELLDVLSAKVRQNRPLVSKKKPTVLEAYGLDIRECTEEEERQIIHHLSSESAPYFKRAFRVRNRKTDARYENCVHEFNLDTHWLYHGSRNANYAGIITEGLRLNPKAPITGKMFGYGLYFANRARKSLNYTDIHGSLYARGHSNKAYLAVYKVAYKNPLHVSVHRSEMCGYTKDSILPHDALFAHKGASLVNDEIIVYREEQATLQYLIELQY